MDYGQSAYKTLLSVVFIQCDVKSQFPVSDAYEQAGCPGSSIPSHVINTYKKYNSTKKLIRIVSHTKKYCYQIDMSNQAVTLETSY